MLYMIKLKRWSKKNWEIFKPGSSNAEELVVEEDFIFPKPLQIVDDDQTKINTERSIVLHPLLAMDEHTPLPIPRERRPGSFNTSPYVTTVSSEPGITNYTFYILTQLYQ